MLSPIHKQGLVVVCRPDRKVCNIPSQSLILGIERGMFPEGTCAGFSDKFDMRLSP